MVFLSSIALIIIYNNLKIFACVIENLYVLLLNSMGRLNDCVWGEGVLPVFGFVTATDFLWLEQGLTCSSVFQMGFVGWVGI
jgi:hypothetical protein